MFAVMTKKAPPVPLPNFADLLLDAICLVDAEGHFVFVSSACERIFGYTQEEIVGKKMYDLIFSADLEKTRNAAQDVLSGECKTSFENRYVRKDGRVVDIMWSARWSESDNLRVAVARDITERKHAERLKHALYAISEAANSTEDLALLFERVHEVIKEHTPAANFFVALRDDNNRELHFPYTYREQQTSQASPPQAFAAEVMRRGESIFLTPDTGAENTQQIWTDVGEEVRYCFGLPLRVQNETLGSMILLSYCQATRYTEKDQELLKVVANQVATVIDRHKMHARLRHRAEYDELTGLPNRVLLHDRLKTALERARRQEQKLALLFVDLDKFKAVNDSLGHLAGDYLLQIVATRLKGAIRESDTVARIGGDEFAVLLEGAQTQEQATMAVEKILTALHQPLSYEGHDVCVLASIGVAFYPEHGEDERELINYADRAMYASKR